MTAVTLVVARADNGVIGEAGRIPWHISDDMRRFKALTLGKPVAMGRKTWESLPRKPLPQRSNIVITRDPGYAAEGATIVYAFAEALSFVQSLGAEEIMVIGGAEIYRAALPFASRVELTEVHAEFSGDVVLPAFDPKDWQAIAREERATADGLKYSYVTLEKKPARSS